MRVFVSYSPQDEEIKKELLKHLAPAIRAGVVAPWDASKVQAGDEQPVVAEAELGRAEVALVLLSASYLDLGGPADRDLVRIAARRTAGGLRVVPIVVAACDWESEPRLTGLVVLPRDHQPLKLRPDREEALVQVGRELVALATAPDSTAPDSAGPAAALSALPGPSGAAPRPSAPDKPVPRRAFSWRNPGSVLMAAVAAVPVMKYALGAAGLAAVVAIVTRGFGLDAGTAIVGTLIVLALMALLIVLAVAARQAKSLVLPAMVLTWAVLGLTLGSSALLLSSLFFHWPRPLQCLVRDEACGQAKLGSDQLPGKLPGAAPTAAATGAAPAAAEPSPPPAVVSSAAVAPAKSVAVPAAPRDATLEVNSGNEIEDSPGAQMNNHVVMPGLKGPARLNSGNRVKNSQGAKMDNRILVTP